MDQTGKWFYMLNKRLYQKPSFVAILLAILLLICSFSFVAESSDKGLLHVVLAQQGKGDVISDEIIQTFLTEDSLLRFSFAPSPEDAQKMVQSGQADSAWIFSEDLSEKISDFVAGKEVQAVQVVEREQNVFLRISREKLYGVLYRYASPVFFVHYARTTLTALDPFTDAQLLEYFEHCKIDDSLFVFQDVTANDLAENYLITPIRGVLSLMTMLGGLAAVLYCMQDRQKGVFDWAPPKRRLQLESLGVLAATLQVSLVSMVALCVSGIASFGAKEVVGALVYGVSCAAFCMVIYSIFGNIKLLSAVIPALMVMLACLCPVFYGIKSLRLLSFLFPPTYYINLSFDGMYLGYMLLYTLVCFGLVLLLQRVRRQK